VTLNNNNCNNSSSSKLERLKICERIYELHLEGKNQTQIATAVNVSQANVSRSLKALQRDAVDYINKLAKGRIVGEYKEILDSLIYIKKRTYAMIEKIESSDNKIIDESTKAKLLLAGFKVIIQADSERYKILVDSPSILAVHSMNQR
jgi:ribosomal 50S subunit-associated protein YjgA (DUF615 family)